MFMKVMRNCAGRYTNCHGLLIAGEPPKSGSFPHVSFLTVPAPRSEYPRPARRDRGAPPLLRAASDLDPKPVVGQAVSCPWNHDRVDGPTSLALSCATGRNQE